MFAGMIPMVISILARERPLLAHTQISSLECTHNNNRSMIHLHYTNSLFLIHWDQIMAMFLIV